MDALTDAVGSNIDHLAEVVSICQQQYEALSRNKLPKLPSTLDLEKVNNNVLRCLEALFRSEIGALVIVQVAQICKSDAALGKRILYLHSRHCKDFRVAVDLARRCPDVKLAELVTRVMRESPCVNYFMPPGC